MPKSNLQRRKSYYERIIEEGMKSPYDGPYKEVCTELSALIAISDKLKGPDHILKPEEVTELREKYDAILLKCDNYLKNGKEFNGFEKSRIPIVTEISNMIKKDIRELRAYDPKSLRTLSEVIGKARRHTIVLDEYEARTMGGALSSRYPVKTIDGRKGFFTRNKSFNLDDKWKSKIEEVERRFQTELGIKLPEKTMKILELMKTDIQERAKIGNRLPHKPIPLMVLAQEGIEKQLDEELLIPFAKEIGLGEDEKVLSTFLQSKEGNTRKVLLDFVQSIIPLSFEEKVMGLAGIKKDANISNRNCAMSDVARLMGCGHMLAQAEQMEIQIGNEMVEGVFMEAVEGSDLNHLKEDDPLYDVEEDSVENPEFLQQIADLQVLDFICGNVDRHKGNMIYQLDSSKGNPPVFTGIKGIDNDCSLGTPKIEEGKKIMKLVNPESMQFMTPTMIVKVASLEKDTLKFALENNGITEEEIEAAWNRVLKIREALEKGIIKPITKNDWENEKLGNRKFNKGNYFDTIKEIQESCKENEWAKKRKNALWAINNKPIKYIKDRYDIAQDMIDKLGSIVKLREEMENAKAIFFDSSEYTLMKKNFENVETLTRKMAEQRKNNPKAKIKDNDIKNLTKAYLTLAEKTEKYIKLKKLLPSLGQGKKRRAFATKLLDFAQGTLDSLGIEFDKEIDADKEMTAKDESAKNTKAKDVADMSKKAKEIPVLEDDGEIQL